MSLEWTVRTGASLNKTSDAAVVAAYPASTIQIGAWIVRFNNVEENGAQNDILGESLSMSEWQNETVDHIK